MKKYKIFRVSTFDDDELCGAMNEIESSPDRKIKQVIYMGDNSQHVRIYQIIYTEE